jgi:antitoxin MazE
MQTQIKLKKWGNSLAIRVPNSMVKKLELSENQSLELSTKKNDILIKKSPKRQDFLEWFLNSPAKNIGVELDLNRDKSPNRSVEL